MTQRFRKFIVFNNPRSTHHQLAESRLAELRRLYPDIPMMTIAVGKDGIEQLKKAVAEEPHALILIAGGDGTVNSVLSALLTHEHLATAARHTPILPMWGGNANDLAGMLNGFAFRSKLPSIIQEGSIVPIQPLECEIIAPGQLPQRYIAACYISFGATARAAELLNRTSHRTHKLRRLPIMATLRDIHKGVWAILTSPSFLFQEADREQRAYERAFINGSRMAQLEAFPVVLSDKQFLQRTFVRKQKPRSFIPRVQSSHHHAMNEAMATITFSLKEPTWMQYDGEPLQLATGTTVTISHHHGHFTALSTRLPRQKAKKKGRPEPNRLPD
ncbi:MAG TPA: acylglycerol kinase family protein [Candidatus Saccharimonadales bacterium]|nr:acylglycerol kinase family protein [Candidatus Saccharimonadales bacterium]